MSDKKSGADHFVDKLATLYVRMREEKGDDATASTIYDSVRNALGKLGIKLSQEAMEARTKRIASAAIKRAKDELRKQYLIDIDIKAGKGSYALSFFTDVKIPNTPENAERWRHFMGTLAAKTRIGPDPRTGSVGILYRDGAWLGDLVLATDVKSFFIIEDIHTVNGNLVAANARVVNNRFTHELTVKGDLHCNRDLLRQNPPPITIQGGITLLGERRVSEAVAPHLLLKWGMGDGDRLTLRNEIYVLHITDHGAYTEYVLEGENVGISYEWMSDKWQGFKRTRIDPELIGAVNAKLGRICLSLSLGQDFVSPGEKKIEPNIERIATYLECCLQGRTASGREDADTAQELTLYGMIAYLDDLWTMLRESPDRAAVEAHLARTLDDELDIVAAYACKARVKFARKDTEHDVNLLAKLDEEPVDVNELLLNGVSTSRFLMDTFKSDDSRSRLLHVLAELCAAYAALTGPDQDETPDIRPLLADTDKTMADLRSKATGDAGALGKLEQEMRTLRKTTPKELIRKIVNVPIASEEPEFQRDVVLLRDLFAMHDTSLEGLEFDAERILDLIHPAFCSVFAQRIDAVRYAWKGEAPDNPRVKAMADELAGLEPGELIQALRKAMRETQAVIRKYNSLTTAAQTCGPLPGEDDEEYEVKKAAFVMPAHLSFNIQNKLNRLCLTLGLGKQFLEQHSGALEDNILKVEGLIELCAAQAEMPGDSYLEYDEKQILGDVLHVLGVLKRASSGHDEELGAAELEAERFSDSFLERLEDIVKRPWEKVDLTGMKADARILKALLDPNLTVERVFTSSPRLLLYLNSALESKDMKKAVSKHIKPVYFALTKLHELKPEYKRYGLNDFLRSPDRAETILAEVIENRDEPEPRREARKITDALRTLGTKSVRDTLKMLRNTQQKGGSGVLEDDLDLLDSLLAFERGALGSLKLDAKRTGLLLLLSLESFIVEDLKARFESGAISSKNSRQIIQTLHDKLQWHLEIAKTFNKLTPEPSGR